MDPNATLREIDAALKLARPWNTFARQAKELRAELRRWLARGGFAPDWNKYPRAARFVGMARACKG